MRTGLKSLMERNRSDLVQILLTFSTIVLAALVAYHADNGSTDKNVDFFELMALGAVVVAGFAFLAWRRVIAMEREIALRVRAERDALFLAYHDHLTGLPNRRQLAQALDATVAIAPGAGRAHALFMLDLNGFKRVNDTFGHQTGDAVLSLAAKRIAGAMRDGDLLARTGGDEFSIVARDVAGSEGATAMARRIIAAMAEPIIVGGDAHRVGTGIGIALIPDDGPDPQELQRRADVALYRAKAAGGSSLLSSERRWIRGPATETHFRRS